MREVDYPHNSEDQPQTHAHEAVYRAGQKARHKRLEEALKMLRNHRRPPSARTKASSILMRPGTMFAARRQQSIERIAGTPPSMPSPSHCPARAYDGCDHMTARIFFFRL